MIAKTTPTVAVQPGPTTVASAAGRTIYTCPMHPEVQQDHPGDCPKCGMALEPKTVTADTADQEKRRAARHDESLLDRRRADLAVFVCPGDGSRDPGTGQTVLGGYDSHNLAEMREVQAVGLLLAGAVESLKAQQKPSRDVGLRRFKGPPQAGQLLDRHLRTQGIGPTCRSSEEGEKDGIKFHPKAHGRRAARKIAPYPSGLPRGVTA